MAVLLRPLCAHALDIFRRIKHKTANCVIILPLKTNFQLLALTVDRAKSRVDAKPLCWFTAPAVPLLRDELLSQFNNPRIA